MTRRVNRILRHPDGSRADGAEVLSERWMDPESGQPLVVVEAGRVLLHTETREQLTLARRLF